MGRKIVPLYRSITRCNASIHYWVNIFRLSSVFSQDDLDVMREEALDKQLDDEKQLSEVHDQISALRGKET